MLPSIFPPLNLENVGNVVRRSEFVYTKVIYYYYYVHMRVEKLSRAVPARHCQVFVRGMYTVKIGNGLATYR